MSPEVLIYVQSIKHFFKNNFEARKYFNIKDINDEFFDYITKMSQKNFEENGEPELSVLQFEELKRRISKITENHDEITGVFIALGNLGYISLN
jgi:hypothetical protein